MAFNLFNKAYVAPDFAYDAAYNRYIFSQWRNQADYISYDVLDSPGYNSEVKLSTASINDIIGVEDDKYESIAHFIKYLYESEFEGRIYADNDSYMPLFFTWLKIAMPNHTEDSAFIIYNLVKQREALVFPDNVNAASFVLPRLQDRENDVTLTKAEFISALNEFNTVDMATEIFYNELRDLVKDSLCIEVQLASYLSAAVDINVLAEKTRKILTKIVYASIDDIRQYIRDNIMTEKVKSWTGVTLSWEDQDWETTLKNKDSNMAFLFDSSPDAIANTEEYRLLNLEFVFAWSQWLIDNTTDEDLNDMQLADMIRASEYIIRHRNVGSEDAAIRNTAVTTLIEEDRAYHATSNIFDNEYLREKINTFWIEYVYQLKNNGDTDALRKISHT